MGKSTNQIGLHHVCAWLRTFYFFQFVLVVSHCFTLLLGTLLLPSHRKEEIDDMFNPISCNAKPIILIELISKRSIVRIFVSFLHMTEEDNEWNGNGKKNISFSFKWNDWFVSIICLPHIFRATNTFTLLL